MIAVFLSASIPDEKRNARYFESADRIAIRDAVRSLVSVVLPQMPIVWGGHPAITPLVRVVAEGLGATQRGRIKLYQSAFFREVSPADNTAFEDVVVTPTVRDDREASLRLMRQRMLTDQEYVAGVFIGGMEGVEDECRLFNELCPAARTLPIASTGGAALAIYEQGQGRFPEELATDLAYPTLFRRLLRFPQGDRRRRE